MDSLTAYTLVLGVFGLIGGGFVLWIVPRIESGERRRAAGSHPAE